jgi:Tfp pilus assembly protein PilP
MSEWLNYVKDYATKHNITYKQALRDASPSYKTRNEKKPEVPEKIKQEPEKPKSQSDEKPKRTNKKKVVENITLKL